MDGRISLLLYSDYTHCLDFVSNEPGASILC
jgi:hypothetical protein